MTLSLAILAAIGAYLIGSVPSGYLVIKLLTGSDLTRLGSGRTGGTNAMRAGGVGAGVATGALDIFKGIAAILLARVLLGGRGAAAVEAPWVLVAAGVAVVVGHNWSVFLRGRGGAGTGPNVGVAIALWPFAGLILPPFVVLVLFTTGYASIASLATAVVIPALFAVLARQAGLPWEYVVYGLATCAVITWALRPNIARLLAGEERRVRFGRI